MRVMSVDVHKARNLTPENTLEKTEPTSIIDKEVKEIVAQIDVKQEPKDENEMKSFAQNTMNELLGLYGYERVAEGELSRFEQGSINTSNHTPSDDDSNSTISHENLRETAPIKQMSRRKRNERRTHPACLIDMLDPTTNNRLAKRASLTPTKRGGINETLLPPNPTSPIISSSYDEDILCAWCRKPGRSALTLQENDVRKSFCSEKCFASCRRANFKRTRVCDWCKQVRQVREYLDNTQNEGRLQFCSAECLENYKMAVFCSEIKNTDKERSNTNSPNNSEHLEETAQEQRTSSAELMDLRTKPNPEEFPKRLPSSEAPENDGILKQNNVNGTVYKNKTRRLKDKDCKSQSRGGQQSYLLRGLPPGSSSNGNHSCLPKENIYTMKHKTALGGNAKKTSHQNWTETERLHHEWKAAESLLGGSVSGAFNPLNISMLANAYTTPNFPNLNVMQNLASTGLLGYKSAHLIPNVTGGVPIGPGLSNGIGPGILERSQNVEGFNPNSFILGVLAAGANKADGMLPRSKLEYNQSQNTSDQLTFENPTSDVSHGELRATQRTNSLNFETPVQNSANSSNPLPKSSTNEANMHYRNEEKSCFPFPTLLVPFPVPFPVPIPVPINNHGNVTKSKPGTNLAKENTSSQTRNKNVSSKESASGPLSPSSAIDLTCKSKYVFSSDVSSIKKCNSETIEGDVASPCKKSKLST